MDGSLIDPFAVDAAGVPLPVTELALERDALRGDWLAVTVGMCSDESEEAGWAEVYLTRMPGPPLARPEKIEPEGRQRR